MTIGFAPKVYWQDADKDGYYAYRASHCSDWYKRDRNDNDPTIHPDAPERCDGKDNDCDGQVDEGVKNTYYRDADGDTYGTSSITQACSYPSGYTTRAGDCNDNNASIHPGVSEKCNGADDDCDGSTDEVYDVGVSCVKGICADGTINH